MKLMVLDGNSILNRAFYGIRLLTTTDGLYTNAVYGFLMILQKLIAEDSPDALCVAFDLKGPTFRHELFDGYKAKRKGMPEELAVQLPYIKQVLSAMNIRIYEAEGFEADDLIGAIASRCSASGWECAVVTGDRDSLQLIDRNIRVKLVTTRGGKTETTEYDEAVFFSEYGFPPIRLIDLKALMGDSSDNIPGVKGIGEKTAVELIRRFHTLDDVYSRLIHRTSNRRSGKSWRKAGMRPSCPISSPQSIKTHPWTFCPKTIC
jgi:DNA polymerase-1